VNNDREGMEGWGIAQNELLPWGYFVRTKGNHEKCLAG
jgi:hypothetical protein